MDCPKCKQELRQTGLNFDFPAFNEEQKDAKAAEVAFFHCDHCNHDYISMSGKKPQRLPTYKKTEEQIKLENKKRAQIDKLKEYQKKKYEEKMAEKKRQSEEMRAFIASIPSIPAPEETPSYAVDYGLDDITSGKTRKHDAKKPAPAPKKTDDNDDKKARAREYHRQRYEALKAKKNK